MSSKIEEMLNLPSFEEAMGEAGATGQEIIEAEEDDEELYGELVGSSQASLNDSFMEDIRKGDGHAKAMDDVYAKMLDLSEEIRDLALNVDQRGAATLFEKAIMAMKTAADAKDSKRDMQLKAMKLLNDRRKLDIEEYRAKQQAGEADPNTFDAQGSVMDRNELIKMMMEKNPPVDYHERFDEAPKEAPAPQPEDREDEIGEVDTIIAAIQGHEEE